MADSDWKEVDARVFAELDRIRLAELKAKAERTCVNEGCAHKWDHTDACRKAWRAWGDARAEIEAA